MDALEIPWVRLSFASLDTLGAVGITKSKVPSAASRRKASCDFPGPVQEQDGARSCFMHVSCKIKCKVFGWQTLAWSSMIQFSGPSPNGLRLNSLRSWMMVLRPTVSVIELWEVGWSDVVANDCQCWSENTPTAGRGPSEGAFKAPSSIMII